MNNANFILREAVTRKWPESSQKEWWYAKLGDARRRKLLRCSEQQNHRCCYCGCHTWHPSYGEHGRKGRLATLEHIRTRESGGTDSMDNLSMACYNCNNSRGNLEDPIEFYEIVIGVRRRRPVLREADPQKLQERLDNKEARTARLIFDAAATLHVLGLWDWFDLWLLTHLDSYVKKAA